MCACGETIFPLECEDKMAIRMNRSGREEGGAGETHWSTGK
jgi:hypothetical protein